MALAGPDDLTTPASTKAPAFKDRRRRQPRKGSSPRPATTYALPTATMGEATGPNHFIRSRRRRGRRRHHGSHRLRSNHHRFERPRGARATRAPHTPSATLFTPRKAKPCDNRTSLDRRPAHRDGRAQCVGPPPDGRRAGGDPCQRAARAPGESRHAHARPAPHAPLPDPLDRAAEGPRDAPADRLLALDSGSRASASTPTFSGRPRRRLPAHPGHDQDARAARPAGAAHRVRREAARPRARHRADRLGQVDDARLAAPPHQPHPARAHPHDRGPDRVPAPTRELHRQPARDRPETRRPSPKACAPRSARTPT